MRIFNGTVAAFVATTILWCTIHPIAAAADGTVEIHHAGGGVDVYRSIDIRVFSGSLFLTTDNGDGTIVVTSAACWYQAKVIVCLPTTAAQIQDGESRALALKTGTIYLNYTDDPQPLQYTTQKLPAHSVMLALSTKSGTVVTLHGELDQVIQIGQEIGR